MCLEILRLGVCNVKLRLEQLSVIFKFGNLPKCIEHMNMLNALNIFCSLFICSSSLKKSNMPEDIRRK